MEEPKRLSLCDTIDEQFFSFIYKKYIATKKYNIIEYLKTLCGMKGSSMKFYLDEDLKKKNKITQLWKRQKNGQLMVIFFSLVDVSVAYLLHVYGIAKIGVVALGF